MTHTKIKNLLISAIDSVSATVSDYAENHGKDFSHIRKLPAAKLIRFLVAEGSSTTKNELLSGNYLFTFANCIFNQITQKNNNIIVVYRKPLRSP